MRNAEYEGKVNAIDRAQAVIEFELDGTVITANRSFLQTMGYTNVDEIKGKHHRIFVTPKDGASDEYRSFWDRLARGEFESGEYMRVGRGGRERCGSAPPTTRSSISTGGRSRWSSSPPTSPPPRCATPSTRARSTRSADRRQWSNSIWTDRSSKPTAISST
ncbi:PAS domain-containing protein [Actinoplanes awajinensis]